MRLHAFKQQFKVGFVTHWFDVKDSVSYVTITAIVGVGLEFPVLEVKDNIIVLEILSDTK